MKRTARLHQVLAGAGCLLALYCAAYAAFRPYAISYAPYAWGRPKPVPLTSSIVYYPFFSKLHPSLWESVGNRTRPVAYYAFAPLVEVDLALNNHPGNPFDHWEIFGSNWP
jgi:hypothetical protein